MRDYTKRSPYFGSEIVTQSKKSTRARPKNCLLRRNVIMLVHQSCSSYSTIPEWKKELPVERGTAPSALRDKYGGQVHCVTYMVGTVRGIRLCCLTQERKK